MRGSYCGVTIGNRWLRNNPDLDYPEGHEFMMDAELKRELEVKSSFHLEQEFLTIEIVTQE